MKPFPTRRWKYGFKKKTGPNATLSAANPMLVFTPPPTTAMGGAISQERRHIRLGASALRDLTLLVAVRHVRA